MLSNSSFQRSKLSEGVLLVFLMMEGIYLLKFRPAAVGEKLSDCSMKVKSANLGIYTLSPSANYTEIMNLDQI